MNSSRHKLTSLKSHPPRAFTKHAGFALVATISMMVILVIVALGLLTLSTITLKSTSLETAEAEARANARMALMTAIGELQLQMGPDQRISANSAILDNPNTPSNEVLHPHYMGSWNSWKAGDGNSFHRSVEGESLIGMAPTYVTGRNDYFRSWLVSLTPGECANWQTPLTLSIDGETMPTEDKDAVLLVGKGSLGKNAQAIDFVSARLIDCVASGSGNRGRFAWWAGDQSQKARVMGDSYDKETSLTLAQEISRGQAPGSTGSKTIQGLEDLTAVQETKLDGLPSLGTLDVVPGVKEVVESSNSYRASQKNFHSITSQSDAVIADVREGGLKRDLSALLERRINPAEVDSAITAASDSPIKSHLLYHFKTKDSWANSVGSTAPQETVPLQDLAAYYQLYDSVSPEAGAQDSLRTSNLRGVRYAPTTIGTKVNGFNGIHMLSTDFGTTSLSPVYPTAHSSIYRQPRIIKIQILASLFSRRINPPIPPSMANPSPNTHEILIGITPAVTFWNPTNLPVIFQMNSNPALSAQMLRFGDTPIQIRFNKNSGQTITTYQSIQGLTGINDGIFSLYWAGIHPISMEPGEIKTLSLPFSGDLAGLKALHGYNGHWNQGWAMSSFFMKTDTWYVGHEVKVGWEPESFIYCNNSASPGTNNGTAPITPTATDMRHVVNGKLRFKNTDRIQIEIGSGNNTGVGWMNNSSSYQDFTAAWSNWDRFNSLVGMRRGAGTAFYQPLFQRGMTGGAATLTSPSRSGSSIIARSSTEAGWPFMHFGVMAGTETSETSNGGFAGGRKFAGRPFLHSSTLHSHPILDNSTGNDLYNWGWNWSVDLLNDVYEAPVQVTNTGSGYWGGGYTPESGTTHVIQQEIPILPPISIASLSHARLGGWSVSDQMELPYPEMSLANSTRRRTMTRAVGFGGLRPHTLQAIGNSYAHPQIPANQTYTTVSRTFNTADGAFNETFADHSYLANKALWDEYFFSSITPQRPQVEVFESPDREALDVARDFFFDDKPLLNRRIKPYVSDLTESKLNALFAQKDLFADGLADKIAAHLMVQGPFNINSTSVEAWKIFFSSLKAKPVSYLNGTTAMTGSDPSVASSHTGTPVGQIGLSGGAPFSGSPDDPSNPEQWTSWRELTDTEINELAVAMVKQVKLRGPFLSLSEFVNRRLEGSSTSGAAARSVKGALQSALDDPDVSINAAFREVNRKFSASELATMSPAFPLAAEGPIAYGSSAYIDQADILRGFAEQLTPRGDTFIIRSYGDSIDRMGNVVARAWCEAIIQRTPEYVDATNAPELKAADSSLTLANQTFGRKLILVSFRWLNPLEV